MKKYITLSALLAAGATFANAETIDFSIDRDDTSVSFDLSDSALDSLYTLTYEKWSYSGAGNNTTGFQTPVNANYQNTFSPDGQLRTGTADSWTMNFTFTNNGTGTIILSGFTFDCYAINGGGSDKNADVAATLTLSAGEQTSTSGSFDLGRSGETETGTLTFDSGIEVLSGDSVSFALKMSDVKTYNTYSGIKSGSFTIVPEPSAFGLLAGAGALALVASRRRRR